MNMLRSVCWVTVFGLIFIVPSLGAEQKESEAEELRREINDLRQEMNRQRREYEVRLGQLQDRLDELSERESPSESEDGEVELQQALEKVRTEAEPKESVRPGPSGVTGAIQSMNPDISAIIDTYYHSDDADGGIESLFGRMDGFGHTHGHDDGHQHAHTEDGFNMRHLELAFTGDVDPYFKGTAIAAISEHGAEMEEAYIETLSLPANLKVKAGKFFSDFGRINSQHSHEWDFTDQPLIYRLLFGTHNFNEKGVQLSWLAPTPFYLEGGVEALQGENHLLFDHHGGAHLPDEDGPRLGVGWLKFGPDLGQEHGLELGLSYGRGAHQEAHDGNADGIDDHWLDGRSEFWGFDGVYKYNSPKPYGEGDFTLQAEYLRRKKDLEIEDHLLKPSVIGRDRVDTQDGFYVQGTYGFAPRWRTGLRWDRVGLANESELPSGVTERFDKSDRLSAMLDFTPTHFSRLRLGLSRGDYAVEGGHEDAWEFFFQIVISLGTHGAHEF